MKSIDLHTHTIYSDGSTRPKQNVIDMAMIGIETMAITDHDTTIGYNEAKIEADKWGIEVITGVEISTKIFHILGYDFDIKNQYLQEFLEYSRRVENEKTKRRIEIIRSTGIPLTYEQVRNDSKAERLGKFNIGISMYKDRAIRTMTGKDNVVDILRAYMGKGAIAHHVEAKYDVLSREAIGAIHKAGGIAIVAHPFKETDNPSELEHLLKEGIDGLEIQPNYKERNTPYKKFAQDHNLLITYGSDFHGPRLLQRPLLPRGYKIEPFWEAEYKNKNNKDRKIIDVQAVA